MLQGRRRAACSDKSRAIRWRGGREGAQRRRDDDVRALLQAALERLEDSTG